MDTFDNALKEFISGFSFKFSNKYGAMFETLDDYLYWEDYVLSYHGSDVKKKVASGGIEMLDDIKVETKNLEEARLKLQQLV